MTPHEKWSRLCNPQTCQDYGLGMTLDEVMQVPEARAQLQTYVPLVVLDAMQGRVQEKK